MELVSRITYSITDRTEGPPLTWGQQNARTYSNTIQYRTMKLPVRTYRGIFFHYRKIPSPGMKTETFDQLPLSHAAEPYFVPIKIYFCFVIYSTYGSNQDDELACPL